jgi:formylmethanofuran dehydrogenase subunit E
MDSKHPDIAALVDFHGHLCPGLAIGYRATLAGLERLGIDRAEDEELIAIVENDSCSVDAAQLLAGTTFGKGNLFFRDYGKQVFTFARRDEERAVRVALKAGAFAEGQQQSAVNEKIKAGTATEEDKKLAAGWRQEKLDRLLNAPLEELFDVREVVIELPPPATIHRSVICESCGDPVMETRTVKQEGKIICLSCQDKE